LLLRGRVYNLQDISSFSVPLGVSTFDAFICELYDEGRYANRGAKNGERVGHRARTWWGGRPFASQWLRLSTAAIARLLYWLSWIKYLRQLLKTEVYKDAPSGPPLETPSPATAAAEPTSSKAALATLPPPSQPRAKETHPLTHTGRNPVFPPSEDLLQYSANTNGLFLLTKTSNLAS
jgi:hypothetical protein